MNSDSNNENKESLDEGGLISNNIFAIALKSDEEVRKCLQKEADEILDSEINEENNIKNVEENLLPDEEVKKSLRLRLFGRIDPGSVRGSIFNLAILSLGSGCLALPQKFGQMSILIALIDIVLAGLASYWTLNILIIASEKLKIYNYSQLVKNLYGKGMSLFLDITMLIFIFGIIILYQVISYKLLGGVVNDIGGYGYKSLDDFFKNSFWSEYEYKFPIMYGTAAFIIFPLCLLKNISKMRFNSLFGIFSLFFLVIIVIVQMPSYFSDYWNNIYKEDDPSTHLNIWDASKGFTGKLYFFKGTATLFFAYSCHCGAFPVYKELKNNVLRRIQKVFARSILLDGAFYTVVGISGYLTNPINTPDLIIERYSLFSNDVIMTIGRIAFVFTLFMKLPANYNSFRIALIGLMGYEDSAISTKLNLLITIPTLAISCLIAVLYSSVTDYISLMGSFCAVIIAFFLPGILYIKANEYPISHYKNVLTIIIITFLCLIGLTSGIITIRDMIRG